MPGIRSGRGADKYAHGVIPNRGIGSEALLVLLAGMAYDAEKRRLRLTQPSDTAITDAAKARLSWSARRPLPMRC